MGGYKYSSSLTPDQDCSEVGLHCLQSFPVGLGLTPHPSWPSICSLLLFLLPYRFSLGKLPNKYRVSQPWHY